MRICRTGGAVDDCQVDRNVPDALGLHVMRVFGEHGEIGDLAVLDRAFDVFLEIPGEYRGQ